MKRLFKKLFPFLLLVVSLVIVYLSDSNASASEKYLYTDGSGANGSSSVFNIQNSDVIVLLHIPGTGTSSFSQSLVTSLITDTPCGCPDMKTRCSCKNKEGNQWLFQSYNSTGFVCGENADWTALTECPIDAWMQNVGRDNRRVRRYWMLSFLREPAARFIQEWHHLVTRDAYFRNEPRLFRKESAELQKKELPCLVGKHISHLTAREFLDCKNNPAVNRMTRMLANLTEVNSLGYHGDKYDSALLDSAIQNLEQLPFFGISEKPKETQILLEATLGLKFSRSLNFLPSKHYKPISEFELPANLVRSIRLANHLDVRVYDHALRLFDRQLEGIKHAFPSLDADTRVDHGEDDNEEFDQDLSDNNNDNNDEGKEDKRNFNDDEDNNDKDNDDKDDDFDNYDERHEKKIMHIDESVLDYSVKEEDGDDPINIGADNIDFETERNDEKALSEKGIDEDDNDIDDAENDDLKKGVNKLTDRDEDFDYEKDEGTGVGEEEERLEKPEEDLDEEEDKIIDDDEEDFAEQIRKINAEAIVKRNEGNSKEIQLVNKGLGINNKGVQTMGAKGDVKTLDNQHSDSSKTNNNAKDTEDVNEFFNMLAESKRKQQVVENEQNPQKPQQLKETNKVGAASHNAMYSDQPASTEIPPGQQSAIKRIPPLSFGQSKFQNNIESPNLMQSSKMVKSSKLQFEPKLLRGDPSFPTNDPPGKAPQLPQASLLSLGGNPVRINAGRPDGLLLKKLEGAKRK